MSERTELGQRQGAALADPRGNTRQVAGGAQGQPPPAAPPGTLAEALIRLQGSLPRITKDDEAQTPTKTGMRTYAYANLATIHDAVFPLLAKHGFTWVCRPTIGSAEVFVLAYSLTHAASGQEIAGTYPLPTSGTPQQIGSAITYARRYTLTAVLGIAPAEDDDDGAGAETAARASYEERVAAGRMSREQMREHGQLERDVKSSPKRAERISGPAPDNADWETSPEDDPGSITGPQLNRLHALFSKVGATEREDRLSLAMSLLDLPHLGSSKELSFAQAETLARKLQDHIGEGS